MNAPPNLEKAPARAENTEPGMNQEDQEDATAAANSKAIDVDSVGVKPVADYYHAPSERFLVRNESGRWLPHSLPSYKRILVNRGLQTKVAAGEVLSEVDLKILDVQNNRDVTGYGPLCGRNAGFIDENGTRFLVTEDMNLIEPVKGSCPTILRILSGLFYDSETEVIGLAQMHTVCGYLKSSVEALRAGRQQPQQALVICGCRDCGKSLFQHLIVTPCITGRSADAERYFLRGNDFNADLFKAEHLFLDDAHSSTATRDRVAFGAKIKAHTVGATVKSLHSKGKDAINVAPWWRFTISTNDSPEDMMVLPPLTDGVEDKLILLRASRFEFMEPTQTHLEKERFRQKIRSEIPAFLYWLINECEIPASHCDRRYNVATFHHPDLKKALEKLSPESELLDLIDLAFKETFRTDGSIRRTAAQIEEEVSRAAPCRARRITHFANSCASYLGRLAKAHPGRVQKADTSQERAWMLFPPNGTYDTDNA